MVKVVCYDHFLMCDTAYFIHLWKLIKQKKGILSFHLFLVYEVIKNFCMLAYVCE